MYCLISAWKNYSTKGLRFHTYSTAGPCRSLGTKFFTTWPSRYFNRVVLITRLDICLFLKVFQSRGLCIRHKLKYKIWKVNSVFSRPLFVLFWGKVSCRVLDWTLQSCFCFLFFLVLPCSFVWTFISRIFI